MRDKITAKVPLIGAAAVLMLGLTACGGGASGLSEHQDALDSVSDFESALSDVEVHDDLDDLEGPLNDLGEALACFEEALEQDAEAAGELVPQASGADAVAGGAAPSPEC